MIAEVIINRTAKKLNRIFDYKIPDKLKDLIFIGSKVLVPFGNGGKLEEAYVVKIKQVSDFEVKEIVKVETNLNDKQIELAKWMAKQYFCNVSDCINLMVTPGTRSKIKKVQEKKINVIKLKKTESEIKEDIQNKTIKSDKQRKILEFVLKNDETTIPEIESFTECSRGIVNTLIKNGYLEISEKQIKRDPLKFKNIEKSNFLKLTEEQTTAFKQIEEKMIQSEYEEFLLYGITGSGKTEIYLQLIYKTLKMNKTSIVLVPEISLTPQMLDRFISRFGKEKIAILHSKLSAGEKYDEWNKIKEGNAKIVIGARSAIFAPLQNIGIIIIDEDHDSSYKSEANPKYDSKQVAKYIAKQNSCPLVLGSATPDMNTFYKTEQNEIKLLKLTKRANKSSLPNVSIIDLKQELANGNHSMLSNELYTLIEENLKHKRQTILFLNRRGYSTFIMCRDCGYTVKCKNCDISLTYHRYEKKLKCHYCGYEQEIVTKCPECNSDKIRYFGTGTQKLEQEIQKQFPGAKTIRMDVDTVTKKNSHEEILNKFKNENIDILIGTQMVVKGHHFPNVTLVGVIAADSSLNIDDYRANERTFQILTQVAGRAGREKIQGNVIIQTYNPDSFSIQCAKEQNYHKFYNTEIVLREQLKYPPFCDIIVIGFNGIDEKQIQEISQKTYIYLKRKIDEILIDEDINIFKPMPAPIAKIQNKFRYRIIIKAQMNENLNYILNEYLKQVYRKDLKSLRISIDVNPNNMS